MTLDTYGLSEEEYLAIFEQKAEFACKAIRLTGRVADGYNIKLEPELWWNLHQEIGYATDDACRVKQKKEDPQAIEERSYTTSDYPTTATVCTAVQNLDKVITEFIKDFETKFFR